MGNGDPLHRGRHHSWYNLVEPLECSSINIVFTMSSSEHTVHCIQLWTLKEKVDTEVHNRLEQDVSRKKTMFP